ncbi:cytochrome b [Xylophilus rhododendri]|uniref:Cytochrome b n=1 Tax=Xylophilus rhododendri TaxID=2697032 RepID=A0A857J6E2_9BURK|nr:cytochrome b [Xylophilus rhododendri]QHI98803.1 cytochrome b [Xylophilus rhododendri]
MSPAPSSTLLQAGYTRPAIVLHWLIAAAMVANVAIILSVEHLPDDWVRPAVDTHKSFGITVLGLALLRLLWRIGHRPPALPGACARWEVVAAHIVHVLLYLVMFWMPLSGWLHDSAWNEAATHPMKLFGTIGWPRVGFIENLAPDVKEPLHTLFGQLHTWGAYVLYGLLFLHIAGALKHQFFDREAVLRRMWFKRA